MSGSSNDEIVQGYIEEVRTYIPSLTRGLESLSENPDQGDAISEVHRLVHIIKGASAMVGISGLSHIASQMEDTLDDIMAGTVSFSNEAFQVMTRTVGQFQKYCDHFLEDGVNARSMLKKTVLAFQRVRSLPSDEDDPELQKLLDIVPEKEGGNHSDNALHPHTIDIDSEADETSEITIPEKEIENNSDNILSLLHTPEEKTDDETIPETAFVGLSDSNADANQDMEADDLMAILETETRVETEDDSDSFPEITKMDASGTDLSPELMESFYEEAEEHLQELARSLNNLEAQIRKPMMISSEQRELIRQIRRSVHTLKGASAIIGLSDISAYAHSVEDLLDWLYETAQELTPDVISTLVASADMLERMIASRHVQRRKIQTLKADYQKIMAFPESVDSDAEIPAFQVIENVSRHFFHKEDADSDKADTTEIPEPSFGFPSPVSKTLRVGTERIDELVNLTGELIIASSAFDQKMDIFMNALKELELSRDRLRSIARNMEISYEVKALEQIRKSDIRIQTSAFEDFDTMELDRYSELNLIIRTLNESVIDVGAIGTNLVNLYSDFDGHLNRQRVLLSELQDKVMRVRMTPMQIIVSRLRRTVREVASQLGKKNQACH